MIGNSLLNALLRFRHFSRPEAALAVPAWLTRLLHSLTQRRRISQTFQVSGAAEGEY